MPGETAAHRTPTEASGDAAEPVGAQPGPAGPSGTEGGCADPSAEVVVASLEVHTIAKQGGLEPDALALYAPVVSLHLTEASARPEGRYVTIAEGMTAARGYVRAAPLWVSGGDIVRTLRGDVVVGADGGELRLPAWAGPLCIDEAGRVVGSGSAASKARPGDGGFGPSAAIASFGGRGPDGVARCLAASPVDGGSGSEDDVEERLLASGDAGAFQRERWRTLFEARDVEPIDDCRASVAGTEAVFRCAEGAHPSARVTATDGAVVVTVTGAGGVGPNEHRFALPPGVCVRLSAEYRQFVPNDDRTARRSGRVDPFERIASDHARTTPVRALDRCTDAGPGAPLDIRLRVPRHGGPEGAILSVPAIGLRRSLGIGVVAQPGAAWTGQRCEARAYPRSALAIVRCYGPDEGTTQRTIFVEHDELLSQTANALASGGRGPVSDLLPCHAAVRFVVEER